MMDLSTASKQNNNNAVSSGAQPSHFLGSKQEEFFSICFQRYESINFYSQLLQKVLNFAKTLDEGTGLIRESIWQQLHALMGVPTPTMHDPGGYFLPLLSVWLQEPTINLFGLELLYIAFMLSTSGNADANLNPTSEDSGISSAFTPWGSTIPSALYQLSLVSHLISSVVYPRVLHDYYHTSLLLYTT
jgi:hypothetical protein